MFDTKSLLPMNPKANLSLQADPLSRKNQVARWLLLPMGLSLVLGFLAIGIPNAAPEDSMGVAILLLLTMIAALLCWMVSVILAIAACCKGEQKSLATLGLAAAALPVTAYGFWMAMNLRLW